MKYTKKPKIPRKSRTADKNDSVTEKRNDSRNIFFEEYLILLILQLRNKEKRKKEEGKKGKNIREGA